MSALGYSVNWLERLYVRQRLEEIADTTGCSWLISMDLDSIVREIDLPLDVILDGLAEKYGLKHGVGGVFAKEVFIQGAFTSPWHHVNASVFMTQSSVHGMKLVNAQKEPGRDHPDARVEWPAEQGTITELLFPGKYITKIANHPREVEASLGVVTSGISSTWKDCPFELFMLETRVLDSNIITADHYCTLARVCLDHCKLKG